MCNHLADLIAGGAPLPTDLINIHSSTTISALEVATYIQPSWYWTHANSPNILLSEPLNDARDGRWRQYQLNRDGPHVLNGEEPLHLGSAMEFSAGVWNMAKLPILPRAQAVRLTMDKQVQGTRNE